MLRGHDFVVCFVDVFEYLIGGGGREDGFSVGSAG